MSLDYRHANEILNTKPKHSLWLGDCAAAQDIEWITRQNIRMVVTAAAGLNVHYDSSIRHYQYLFYDVKTENMFSYLDDATDKIHKGLQWGSVLVHCGAGVSRSATLVLAYLIKYNKMSFLEALKFTKSKRPEICPNLGFEQQLKRYAKLKALNPLVSLSHNSSLTASNENFLRWIKTSKNKVVKADNNQSFPQIQLREKKCETIVQKTQKAWRITSSMDPRTDTSIDHKKDQQGYLKNMAKFRFGMTNASKWGIY